MLAATARPLSDDEKRCLSSGRARCSALRVPYRATPRLPIRPVGDSEVAALVAIAERLASLVPRGLIEHGLHPRILASGTSLSLFAVYAILLLVRPRTSSSLLLQTLWWMLLFPAVGLGGVCARRWAYTHKASQPAAAESWVPWLAEQLARGTSEDDLREYLRRALPSANAAGDASAKDGGAAPIERMLERARARLQR